MHRGTEIAEDLLNELGTNLLLGVGFNDQWQSSAKKFYEIIRTHPMYKSKQITHIGHSLGGAIGNISAVYNNAKGIDDRSITFNAPGTKPVLKRGLPLIDSEQNFHYIYNFDIAGDYIGNILTHLRTNRQTLRPKLTEGLFGEHMLDNFRN